MPLESATFVSDLVSSNPVGATDQKALGDDHLRLIKSVLQGTFPNASKAFRFPQVLSKSADYSIVVGDDNSLVIFDSTAATRTAHLPNTATILAGFQTTIFKSIAANTVVIDTPGGEKINGADTYTLTVQYDFVTVEYDGANWTVIAAKNIAELPAIGGANTFLASDGANPLWRTLSQQLDLILGSVPGLNIIRGASLWGTGVLTQNYISGLIPSNNSGTPNTKVDVSVGAAADDTQAIIISNSAVKTIDFTVNGANGLDTGALANDTWYRIWIIAKADGTVAGFGSTGASPTLPSGYVYKRLVGWVKTNGSAHFIPFISVEGPGGSEIVLWKDFIRDVNAVSLGTTRTNYTLTVPPARVTAHLVAGAITVKYWVTCPDTNDQAPVDADYFFNAGFEYASGNQGGDELRVLTNTSGQVAAKGEGSGTFNIWTIGWMDSRRV